MCLSALRNIEINFAPLRHVGYANFRECHQTCAGLSQSSLQLLPALTIASHCANQNQHDSDLFVDFLRKWSGTQVSRMRNMTRKQTESKQSGHRCISHRVPWCTELKRSNITVGPGQCIDWAWQKPVLPLVHAFYELFTSSAQQETL